MTKKTITFILVTDGYRRTMLSTMDFHDDHTYIIDLPIHDIKDSNIAQINVTILQEQKEP